MLFSELIATSVAEVGISWFDFYSIGHICMGVGIFLFFSLFYTIPHSREDTSQVIFPLWLIWIITIIMGVLWEVLENVLFFSWGIKFENRLDSVSNMTTDVILVALGGLVTWAVCYLIFEKDRNVWAYYLFGIVGFTLWIVVFIVLRYLTYKNTPFF